MPRITPLIASLIFASGSAQALEVLTSFKPIQLITLELTKGVTTPDVLMESNASPHDYAMRPSDAKKVQDADVIIWWGHELETFMARMVEGNERAIIISEFENINFREFADDHGHDGHDHGSTDPHFWLGLSTTQAVAKEIVNRLAERDPANQSVYMANYDAFAEGLEQARTEIIGKLAPIKDKGYFVFHDAYGYFEEEFGLNNIGHFTVSPERKPGAKTLIHIRTTLNEGQGKCVFSEPQFTPAVVKSVTRGSNVPVGVLDPVASNIEAKPGGYFDFTHQLATSFVDCLL
ncbi:zinc ABC transporter substrate-binding protein ZnuA [Vibrio astriarenae]|uniref:zinc ABC transporter substrate-binding protein ZnuA n=1 Tax=Vibrio astriarenae TaxID=1481923 RepID=UPI0037361FB3